MEKRGGELHQIDISAVDFQENVEKVIFHLDTQLAGPGSFPQYMVSKLASEHVKVVLGGQGGMRSLEVMRDMLWPILSKQLRQRLMAPHKSGNFVVTAESIVPNLGVLREYKPMIKEFYA